MNPRSCGNGGFFLLKTLKIALNDSSYLNLLIVFFIVYGTVTSRVSLKKWLEESFFTGLTLILCSSPICF